MRIKVQRICGEFCVSGDVDSLNNIKQDCKTMLEEGQAIYESAVVLLEDHPRFNEIIINTELTDDGEDNH